MLPTRTAWIPVLALAASGPIAAQAPAKAPPPRDTVPSRQRLIADSANYLARVSRLPGRTPLDNTSLTSAIRQGLRNADAWGRMPAPPPGAVLPERRIVAFYGNPMSTRMGILGELPPNQMLARLDQVVSEWRRADPTTPVQPALHLIAVVAQDRRGDDGLYRLRMDTTVIRRVYGWAQSKQAILFLDIQAGHSTIQQELPRLLPWLARPDVHLGIDPEFYMHYDRGRHRPGARIGTLTAEEVNHAIEQLARLVTQHQLPPKVLVIHRFNRGMLRQAKNIRLDPRVQVVINMDGWGPPWVKYDTYANCCVAEPVQFTGFKLFFHNDTKKGDSLLTPQEILALRPRPFYIQYQ